MQGAEASWDLTVQPGAVPSAVMNRFPHLYGCTVLAVPPEAQARLAELLAGQLLVSARDAAGEALDSTGVQVRLRYDGILYV